MTCGERTRNKLLTVSLHVVVLCLVVNEYTVGTLPWVSFLKEMLEDGKPE